MNLTEYQALKVQSLIEYPNVERLEYSMCAVITMMKIAFLLKERNPGITFGQIQMEIIRLQKEADASNRIAFKDIVSI